ncbi:MAG: ABC transporter ATP-binding protein [Bacteroidota bacterium]
MLNVQIDAFDYDGRVILEDIRFELQKGNHLALMGESGSGKSTILKIIYGLLHLNNGSIFWGDKQALGPNYNLVPGESYMKYLSQDFDLMPFTTVEENISEYLSVFTRETHKERINELLVLIDLKDYAKTKVKKLSGGQQQRVALARALAQEPELLLLDEPFSHIDHFKKNELRNRLFPYLKDKGISVLTATHDIEDVLSYADETIVLKDGKIQAHQDTYLLYNNPKTKYVASLFGLVNELPLRLLKEYAELDATLLIYPHEFEISNKSGLEVAVKSNFFKGSHYLVEGITEDGYAVFFTHKVALRVQTKVFLNIGLQLVNKRINLTEKPLSSKS